MAVKAIIALILTAGTVAAASAAHSASSAPTTACAELAVAPAIGIGTAMHTGVIVARTGALAVANGPKIDDGLRRAGGSVRHISSDPRFGVVYVLDRAGGDTVVIDTPAGPTQVPRPGEVSHPTWIAGGDVVWGEGSKLRFWSHITGSVTSSSAPLAGAIVFSPVATSTSSVVAAVVEPVLGVIGEDEQLSNLWRYDRRGGGWQRVTAFTATRDRWSVIRTPQVESRGIGFIRVHGRASATIDPTFQRWSLRGGKARLREVLPTERYLAGYREGRRLWNLPSADVGTWVLAEERRNGALRGLGCGAVEVDPVDVADPDRAVSPSSDGSGADYPVPPPSQEPPAHEVAVLVGDYAGENGATHAADAIIAAYGSSAQVRVVDSDAAPTAVKPGSWAAIMWIGDQGDPVSAIQRFRDKLPQFADRSWVAAP